jgi:hypothetical protein
MLERLQHRGALCRESILRNLLLSRDRILPERGPWAPYRNRHAGKTAFVIGNGPSLVGQDLDKLQGHVTFSANKIHLLFPSTRWRPLYYNVEDLLVAEQNVAAIEEISRTVEGCCFLRKEARRWLGNVSNSIWYEDWHHLKPQPQFSANPATGLFWGSTVCYINLQLAYYMGCNPIVLLGVDFQFSGMNSSQNVLVSTGELNHFSKDYRKPGERWHQPNLERQQQAFEYARDWLKQRGVEVLNATRGGKLEVYRRARLEDVV